MRVIRAPLWLLFSAAKSPLRSAEGGSAVPNESPIHIYIYLYIDIYRLFTGHTDDSTLHS